MSLTFQSALGTKCQQRSQAQVPICVVTTLRHDELLFAHVPVGGGGSTWVIQSVSCSVQRFWNASTATISLVTNALEATAFAPPLPTLANESDKILHNLGPEDSISIWMGYVDNLFADPLSLISLMEGEAPSLMRVFVGIIDTLAVVGTDSGFKYVLQCRDRMRYLMETQVSLSPFDINNDRSYMNLALGGTEESVNRSSTILRLAQLGVGHVTLGKDSTKTETDINGLRIEEGLIKDLALSTYKPKSSAAIDGKDLDMPPPDYLYNYQDRPLGGRTKTQNLDLPPNPKFNIITSRLPFSTESVAKEYTIEQQIPIELIKWLANQETYPTEVFCSPQDGNYYYVPRSADISGLTDPKRLYRTYYYRYQPDGLGNPTFLAELAKKYATIDIATEWDNTVVKPTTADNNTAATGSLNSLPNVLLSPSPSKSVAAALPKVAATGTQPNRAGMAALNIGAAVGSALRPKPVEEAKPAVPVSNSTIPTSTPAKKLDSAALNFNPIAPFSLKPDFAQGIINWKEELTTNAMYTNYLIGNNSPNNTKGGNVILMHMSARPPFLAGRSIAGRNMYVIDETINSRVEAIAVGAQMARIHSKETRSASMTLTGDPSIIPGEIVQVIGSPLHPELDNLDAIVAERYGTIDYLKREALAYSDTLAKIKAVDIKDPSTEKVLIVNGENSAANPNGEYKPLTQTTNVWSGTMVDKSTSGGSPSLLGNIRREGFGTLIKNNVPANTELPKQDYLASASSSGATSATPGTPLPGAAPEPVAGVGAPGTNSSAAQSQMVYPHLKPFRITSGYGNRVHPITRTIRKHHGVDTGAGLGVPTLATLAGVVTTAGNKGGYGKTVVIDHGNDLSSLYGHLSAIQVTVGQQVSTGQQIGKVGSTGNSTGPHLHFELRSTKSGLSIEPTFMNFKIGSFPTQAQIDQRLKASTITATPKASTVTPAPAAEPVKTQVAPTNKSPVKEAVKYQNKVILQSTGITNSLGLVDLKVSIYDKAGNKLFEGTANSGSKDKQLFGTADNNISNSKTPLPYGNYKISQPTAGSSPGVGAVFIPITPLFSTARSALGFHVDNDRLAAPGTVGCIGFATLKEFDEFKNILLKSRVTDLEFVKETIETSTLDKTPTANLSTAATAPTEYKQDPDPSSEAWKADEPWKKSHYNQEPQSVWRVEAVKHQFNSAGSGGGYTVEVVLLSITG